jgi:hypothetical protein
MNSASDIEVYFAKVATDAYSDLFQLELNFLKRTAAESRTEDLSLHPLVRYLDGLILDDPDTSNHHVLVRRYPLEGHVLYLAHDDDSRIVFPSLARLIEAAEKAKVAGLSLRELHPIVSPSAIDQAAISHLIRNLVEGTEEEIYTALTLIPSMDLSDTDLLAKLAAHKNFFICEAVGEEIAKRPSSTLRSIAILCSKHPHPQAARAGAKALRAIGL